MSKNLKNVHFHQQYFPLQNYTLPIPLYFANVIDKEWYNVLIWIFTILFIQWNIFPCFLTLHLFLLYIVIVKVVWIEENWKVVLYTCGKYVFLVCCLVSYVCWIYIFHFYTANCLSFHVRFNSFTIQDCEYNQYIIGKQSNV